MSDVDEDALAVAYEAALALEKSGPVGDAVRAWQAVLALDPADPGGASIRLAALGVGKLPDKAPPAYVATLFDQHAEVFDGILVDQLEYGVPMLLRERFQALHVGPFARMLDLGCGTGLAGEALEDMVEHFTGVDLAEGMIEIAGEKDLYDRLFIADAIGFMEEAAESWDLIVATDVLPYVGDAASLFKAARARAAGRGWLAFSTETLSSDALNGRDWAVTTHHRFAHDADYIYKALHKTGFEVADFRDIMVRREQGNPIMGHLFICRAA
ncbi:MAG: methyltransferase domain-containing protein [Pseudomonadota bacterium]